MSARLSVAVREPLGVDWLPASAVIQALAALTTHDLPAMRHPPLKSWRPWRLGGLRALFFVTSGLPLADQAAADHVGGLGFAAVPGVVNVHAVDREGDRAHVVGDLAADAADLFDHG